jgi:tetratricopeptide (TPR) repeat protein
MSVKVLKILLGMSLLTILFVSCNNTDHKGGQNQIQSPSNSQQNIQSPSMDSPDSYESLLQTDSLNTEIRLKLASYYYTTKNFDKALYHYLIVNRIDKNNMAAIFNLGNLYYDTQQNEQAIKYYEIFLKSDKNNQNVRCDLATCYKNLKRTGKAISILRENIKLNSNHPQSHYNLSIMLKESGKIQEAEDELKIYNNLLAGQTGQMK